MERFARPISLGLTALTLALGGVVLWVQLELTTYLIFPSLLGRLGFEVAEGEVGATGIWRFGGKNLTLASIDAPAPSRACAETPAVTEIEDDCPADVCGDLEPVEDSSQDLGDLAEACQEDSLPPSRFAVTSYEESLRFDFASFQWIHRLSVEAPSLVSLKLEVTSPIFAPSEPGRVRVKSRIEDGAALAPGGSAALLKPYLKSTVVTARILADVEQPHRLSKARGRIQAWLDTAPRKGEDRLKAKGALQIDLADEKAKLTTAWLSSTLFEAKVEGTIGLVEEVPESSLDLAFTLKPKGKDQALPWLATTPTTLKIQGPLSDPEVLTEEELAFRKSPEFAYVSEYNHDCYKGDFLASDILKEKLRETRADVWAVDCYANGGGANLLSFDLRRDGRPGLIAALVHPESLLAKIGIAEGDRILRLGGKRVTSDQPEDFADAIFGGKRRILVEVSKKGRVSRHMVVRVSNLNASRLVATPKVPVSAIQQETLTLHRDEVDRLLGPGFTTAISACRFAAADREGQGLKILSLARGSLLERFGLAEGDVVLQVGFVPLTSLEQALEIFQALEGEEATFVIKRGKQRFAKIIRIEGRGTQPSAEGIAH